MHPENFLYLATLLFCIGLVGVMIRRNLFVVYLSIELILSSVNLILATFSRTQGDMSGSVISLLMIAVIAAEAAIFLSLIVYIYRTTKTVDSKRITKLSNEREGSR
jgi:NADH-quinone oxidoreductase subunit K